MLPNFLIIGAARSGTSTLYSLLQEHSDIYLPKNKRPEPHYFFKAAEYERGLEYYQKRYFSAWDGERAIGETSTSYIFGPDTPARIACDLPGVRLIAMLRNPIERAYSNYWHTVASGLESLDFQQAINRESERTAALAGTDYAEVKPYSYLERGLYFQQLQRWLPHFDRGRMHFVIFDDFVSDTVGEYARVLEFLDVDTTKIPANFERVENRSVPGNAAIPAAARDQMRQYFDEDVRAMEGFLGRDLSHWLS